jgi:hypothetical protein
MAKTKSKRTPARAGVRRPKAAKKAANKRKRVVALKQPEAVAIAPDITPRSDTAAERTPVFFWPYEVLRWWMPRDTARKGT